MAWYERWFWNDRASEQHMEDSNSHWACDDCDLNFESDDALTQHYVHSQNHHYCKECNMHFDFEESRRQHMGDKHWYCREHDRVFKSKYDLHSHYRQSMDHHFCFECEVDFDDEDKLWDHLEEDHQACGECHLLFDSQSELEEHDHSVHNFCTECDRSFQNKYSLQQHLNSSVHRPSNIVCPGPDCDKRFTSLSAHALHLESSACMDVKHCSQHDLVFKSEDGLHSHYRQSPDHHFCFECEIDFDDEDGLWDHLEDDHEACGECHLLFDSYAELEQHDHAVHNSCTECAQDFQNQHNLQQHLNSNVHRPRNIACPSRNCDKQFISLIALTDHLKSGACMRWYCGQHNQMFKSEDDLHSHYRQSLDHHFCFECEDDFDDEDKLWDHLVKDHEACKECHLLFDSYSKLEEHDHSVHDFCTECKRTFLDQHSLQQHLNSKMHLPANILCPGRRCNRRFITPSALTLHFESGACRSGMTRQELNRIVVRADSNNYVTNTARLLGGPPGEYEPPMSAAAWATERSWNGVEFECFLCHSTFKALDRLNQHLQSPRHEQKIYKCPKPDCSVEFVALSALCQHVERGSCGVRMFKKVQDAMESLTRGFNAIAFG